MGTAFFSELYKRRTNPELFGAGSNPEYEQDQKDNECERPEVND